MKKKHKAVEIIESTEAAIQEFHSRSWVSIDHIITKAQLADFLKGKAIAVDNGDYTHVIVLEGSEK